MCARESILFSAACEENGSIMKYGPCMKDEVFACDEARGCVPLSGPKNEKWEYMCVCGVKMRELVW